VGQLGGDGSVRSGPEAATTAQQRRDRGQRLRRIGQRNGEGGDGRVMGPDFGAREA
jgi:hypothetical protein